jgi:hypothetical protein
MTLLEILGFEVYTTLLSVQTVHDNIAEDIDL